MSSDSKNCLHIYTNLIWPIIIQYVFIVPFFLTLFWIAYRLHRQKVEDYIIKNFEGNVVVTKLNYLRIALFGNMVIRSLNILMLWCLIKAVREALFYHISRRLRTAIGLCWYLMVLVATDLFYTFGILTTKMRVASYVLSKKSFMVNGVPSVLIFRYFFHVCTVICLILAISGIAINGNEFYGQFFESYMLGIYALLCGVACVYYGRRVVAFLHEFDKEVATKRATPIQVKKREMIIVLRFYMRVLLAWILYTVIVVILDTRSLYNPFTPFHLLMIELLYRLVDCVLLIFTIRVFEGTIRSKAVPFCNFCYCQEKVDNEKDYDADLFDKSASMATSFNGTTLSATSRGSSIFMEEGGVNKINPLSIDTE
jgi:hypothetical protein